MSERQFVGSAERKRMRDVEACQSHLLFHSKTRYHRGAETGNVAAAEQVAGVGQRLGPGIGGQEVESLGQPARQFGLQRMVVGVAIGRGIRRPAREIGPGDEVGRISGGRKKLRDIVGADEGFQVSAQ